MMNFIISILCAALGVVLICLGISLIYNRYHILATQNITPGTFLHFHYIFGIVLGAADALVGLMSLVIAVLIHIYPMY